MFCLTQMAENMAMSPGVNMFETGYSSKNGMSNGGYMMSAGLGLGLTGFIVIFTFVWVILYSFRPTFVRKVEEGESCPDEDADADPSRCFVASLVISLLLVVIFWMFWSCK